MSQNTPIVLKDIASPKAHAMAHEILEIDKATKEYFDRSAEVFQIRAELEERAQILRRELMESPSAEKAREMIQVVADAHAFDQAKIRLRTPDEFSTEVLPRRFPNMKQVANDLCQEVVNTLHPLRLESEAADATAAKSLGIEKVTSSRTNSIAWLLDDVCMKGTWPAARFLAGQILDAAEPENGVPIII